MTVLSARGGACSPHNPDTISATENTRPGVGFGPSNLALAVAAAEQDAQPPKTSGRRLRRAFFERGERFSWHRGMLIEDATMQVAFLKDLATMRNPVSPFGFIPYLWARGRLAAFINHKTLFPSRIEFHDYLEWAADQVSSDVHYASEVVNVRPVSHLGQVDAVDVIVRGGDGSETAWRSRNVVLAPGLRPFLPPGVEPSTRVWHSSELLSRTTAMETGMPHRFVVVGSGQSAAEVAAYLHSTFRAAEVHVVHGRYGYSPADDSPFANRIFDPEAVDEYFAAPEAVKRQFFDYHANTNYSAVDLDLLEDMYGRMYREQVSGVERLRVHHLSQVESHRPARHGVEAALRFRPTGAVTTVVTDHLIYATGYRPVEPETILGETAGLCEYDEYGRVRVRRDYGVLTRPDVRCGIFLQGGTEHTHGISSSLLSNVAIRAGEILAAILDHPDHPDRPDLALTNGRRQPAVPLDRGSDQHAP